MPTKSEQNSFTKEQETQLKELLLTSVEETSIDLGEKFVNVSQTLRKISENKPNEFLKIFPELHNLNKYDFFRFLYIKFKTFFNTEICKETFEFSTNSNNKKALIAIKNSEFTATYSAQEKIFIDLIINHIILKYNPQGIMKLTELASALEQILNNDQNLRKSINGVIFKINKILLPTNRTMFFNLLDLRKFLKTTLDSFLKFDSDEQGNDIVKINYPEAICDHLRLHQDLCTTEKQEPIATTNQEILTAEQQEQLKDLLQVVVEKISTCLGRKFVQLNHALSMISRHKILEFYKIFPESEHIKDRHLDSFVHNKFKIFFNYECWKEKFELANDPEYIHPNQLPFIAIKNKEFVETYPEQEKIFIDLIIKIFENSPQKVINISDLAKKLEDILNHDQSLKSQVKNVLFSINNHLLETNEIVLTNKISQLNRFLRKQLNTFMTFNKNELGHTIIQLQAPEQIIKNSEQITANYFKLQKQILDTPEQLQNLSKPSSCSRSLKFYI